MKQLNRVIALALALLLSLSVVPFSDVRAENTDGTSNVNYDELVRQIGIAYGLNESDYEATVWEEFSKVLEEAERLTSSEDQYAVDEAAKALEAAIAKLAGVDYSRLHEVLEKVEEYSQDPELSGLWYEMISVLENAEEKLQTSDQAAVDEAAAQVEDLLKEISKAGMNVGVGTIIKEVPVEVLPTDDYCNTTVHNFWPVLFFITVAANVAMIVMIVVYVIRVMKSRQEYVPLVDYDIDDDMLMDQDSDDLDQDYLDYDMDFDGRE